VLLALPNLQNLCLLSMGRAQDINVQDSHAPSQQLWSADGDPTAGYRCFTDSGMQFICKLTKLVGVELSSLQGVTAAGLAGLINLQGLESLALGDLTCDITLSAVPAFSRLTALTELSLSWVWKTPHCEFDPAILAHMTQLKFLQLIKCTPARGTAGAAELLSRLSQLPKLWYLDLKDVQGLEQCSAEAFSALTSSSMLGSLTWETWRPFG